MNPGNERNAAVGSGPTSVYPDLVLQSQERGRKLEAIVEVETGESVNHLEALAQWPYFARLRTPFHLYVPAGMVDVARRLCDDNQIVVNEFWSYHTIGDEVRFTLVDRMREAPVAKSRPTAPVARKQAAPPVKRPARAAAKGAAKRSIKKAAAPRRQKRK